MVCGTKGRHEGHLGCQYSTSSAESVSFSFSSRMFAVFSSAIFTENRIRSACGRFSLQRCYPPVLWPVRVHSPMWRWLLRSVSVRGFSGGGTGGLDLCHSVVVLGGLWPRTYLVRHVAVTVTVMMESRHIWLFRTDIAVRLVPSQVSVNVSRVCVSRKRWQGVV